MLRALVTFSLVSLASAGDYDCFYNGKIYKKGQQFPDGCKMCFCMRENRVICAHNYCLKFPNPIKLKKGDEYDCDYKGKMYKTGERFTDDCNVCFCINTKNVICTEKSCKYTWITRLGGVGKDVCYCNGIMYIIGEEHTQGYIVCTCAGVNAFICQDQSCTPAFPYDEDACSPDGWMYKTSDKDKQRCRTCFCGSGIRYYCEIIKCFPSNGTERVRFQDSCYYKGKLYETLEHFLDSCKECVCLGNNSVRCSTEFCERHQPLPNNVSQDLGSLCEFNGLYYKTGRTFMDGCNECYCPVVGSYWCRERPCSSYKWILRIEDSCEYNGFFLSKNQEFVDAGCQSCKCVGNDNFICREISSNSWADLYAVNPDPLAGSQNI